MSIDFKRHYAKVVVELEGLNKVLSLINNLKLKLNGIKSLK